MAKPTNTTLVNMFPDNLESRLNDNTEIWSVTSKILVKKGTDMEKITAELAVGRIEMGPNGPISPTEGITWTDFTKLT